MQQHLIWAHGFNPEFVAQADRCRAVGASPTGQVSVGHRQAHGGAARPPAADAIKAKRVRTLDAQHCCPSCSDVITALWEFLTGRKEPPF